MKQHVLTIVLLAVALILGLFFELTGHSVFDVNRMPTELLQGCPYCENN